MWTYEPIFFTVIDLFHKKKAEWNTPQLTDHYFAGPRNAHDPKIMIDCGWVCFPNRTRTTHNNDALLSIWLRVCCLFGTKPWSVLLPLFKLPIFRRAKAKGNVVSNTKRNWGEFIWSDKIALILPTFGQLCKGYPFNPFRELREFNAW